MLATIPTRQMAISACLAGAIGSAAAAWLGVLHVNGANVLSPGPLLMVIPAWIIGEDLFGNIDLGPRLIPVLGSLVFLIIAIPLFSPKSKVVWPSALFSGILIATSIAFFAKFWTYGVQFQGVTYTTALATINLAFGIGSGWLVVNAIRSRAYWSRYAATIVPCLWCVWFAFPWLGEMV